jgi:hypothetical protein
MSILNSISRFFGLGDAKPSADASPYYDAISEHFGLDREPEPWRWGKHGRRVATNELPPQHIPITGRNAPLRHGIKEVKHGEPLGSREWSAREPKDSDRQRMDDHLRDGCVAPPKRGGQ